MEQTIIENTHKQSSRNKHYYMLASTMKKSNSQKPTSLHTQAVNVAV